jgi:acyl-CoA thioester hydrolase
MDSINKKIYYHDTDCGGVVYYANYLKYFEEARTEYMNKRGVDLRQQAKQGFLFVVKGVDINYKAPAHYADLLTITTEIVRARNVSLEFSQQVKREDKLLVSARTTLVCVDSNFRPQPMSSELAGRLR